jgi:RNA polymerase sigma-70 factor, ECF subfamily
LEHSAEEQVVETARRGDAKAFGTLYEHYYATMVWVAYSILLDRDLAEDATQQAFVKACEKLADLKRTDRFGAWLTQICRNEARQLLRNRQRSETQQAYKAVGAASPVAEGPDLGMVKAAVDQLAPMYREIVVLHYYNRMDYRRIAATLGVAGHTVRGRLFRARKKIEQTLKRNGYPER